MKNNNSTSRHSGRGLANFFSRELLWKLISLIVAIIMWFLVMNTINPTEIKTFTAAVTLENMEDLNSRGYVVSNLKNFDGLTISVKVEASRPALDELSKEENKKNIRAKIDLSKLEINDDEDFPKTCSAVIVPNLPNNSYMYNYDISSYYPTVAEIVIDKAGTKEVPVELKSYGAPLSGYVLESLESEVKNVTITGPASEVSKAEKAVATVDIANEKKSLEKTAAMEVYDEDDTPLENFIITPSSIPVYVEILKTSTVKIEKPSTTGQLPNHLELKSVDWSPKSISVTGQGENIPESITVPPVDLSNINKETTVTADISSILNRLGLESENGKDKINITISVGIKSAKEYVIPSSAVKINGLGTNLNATIPDKITVEIGGVDNIDLSALVPYVDVTGLGEGKHNLPLKLTLPPGAALKDEAEITVEITKKDEEIVEIETSVENTTSSITESSTVPLEE